jgi:hypothetical protein
MPGEAGCAVWPGITRLGLAGCGWLTVAVGSHLGSQLGYLAAEDGIAAGLAVDRRTCACCCGERPDRVITRSAAFSRRSGSLSSRQARARRPASPEAQSPPGVEVALGGQVLVDGGGNPLGYGHQVTAVVAHGPVPWPRRRPASRRRSRHPAARPGRRGRRRGRSGESGRSAASGPRASRPTSTWTGSSGFRRTDSQGCYRLIVAVQQVSDDTSVWASHEQELVTSCTRPWQ